MQMTTTERDSLSIYISLFLPLSLYLSLSILLSVIVQDLDNVDLHMQMSPMADTFLRHNCVITVFYVFTLRPSAAPLSL